jgi:hypothetical protein
VVRKQVDSVDFRSSGRIPEGNGESAVVAAEVEQAASARKPANEVDDQALVGQLACREDPAQIAGKSVAHQCQ